MITGKEFIKTFSEVVEEEEKLFSTGNEELDALLEKVYSEGVEDGYDYAQKEFSNSDERWTRRIAKNEKGLDDMIHQYKEALKDKNLSEKDRKNIEGLLATAKKVKKDPDSFVDTKFIKLKKDGILHKAMKDMEEGKYGKERAILGAAGSTGIGAVGYGIGRAAGLNRKASASVGAAGLAGSALGALVGGRISDAVVRNHQDSQIVRRDKDILKVSTGDMSKRDFVKKWGGKINGKEVIGTENE